MSAELPGRPTAATTYDVETLVALAWRGDIRVPHFQSWSATVPPI